MAVLVASSQLPVTDRRCSGGTRHLVKQVAACSSAGLNTQGRYGTLRMYQSCRSVYCQATLPSGDELGTGHPLLHSADKWAMFLRHRGEASERRQASASRDTKELPMTLKYESYCQTLRQADLPTRRDEPTLADCLMLIDGFLPGNELGLLMLCRPCRLRRSPQPGRGKAQQPHVFNG